MQCFSRHAIRVISGLAVSIALLKPSPLPPAFAMESSPLLDQARDLIATERSEQALKILRESEAKIQDKQQSDYYFLIARAYQELRNNTKALENYTLAIEANPKSAKAFANRALTKGALKDVDGALNDLNKSISLDPTIPETHLNLGVTFAALNKPQKAIQSFNTAIKLRSNYPDAYRNRGIVNHHLNNTTLACKDWKKARQLKPDDEIQTWIQTLCT